MSSPIRTTKRSPRSRTTKLVLVMPPGSASAVTGPRQQGRLSARVFGSMIIECSSDMLAMSDRVESVARATSQRHEAHRVGLALAAGGVDGDRDRLAADDAEEVLHLGAALARDLDV